MKKKSDPDFVDTVPSGYAPSQYPGRLVMMEPAVEDTSSVLPVFILIVVSMAFGVFITSIARHLSGCAA